MSLSKRQCQYLDLGERIFNISDPKAQIRIIKDFMKVYKIPRKRKVNAMTKMIAKQQQENLFGAQQ